MSSVIHCLLQKKFAFMSRQEAFPAEMPWLVGGRVAGKYLPILRPVISASRLPVCTEELICL